MISAATGGHAGLLKECLLQINNEFTKGSQPNALMHYSPPSDIELTRYLFSANFLSAIQTNSRAIPASTIVNSITKVSKLYCLYTVASDSSHQQGIPSLGFAAFPRQSRGSRNRSSYRGARRGELFCQSWYPCKGGEALSLHSATYSLTYRHHSLCITPCRSCPFRPRELSFWLSPRY